MLEAAAGQARRKQLWMPRGKYLEKMKALRRAFRDEAKPEHGHAIAKFKGSVFVSYVLDGKTVRGEYSDFEHGGLEYGQLSGFRAVVEYFWDECNQTKNAHRRLGMWSPDRQHFLGDTQVWVSSTWKYH